MFSTLHPMKWLPARNERVQVERRPQRRPPPPEAAPLFTRRLLFSFWFLCVFHNCSSAGKLFVYEVNKAHTREERVH
jgi:hypothetical protein